MTKIEDRPQAAGMGLPERIASVRSLTPNECRKLSVNRVLGADADAIWSGARAGLVRLLSRRHKEVVVAFDREGCPASWAVFSDTRFGSSVWVWGNLVTVPAFRRQGLARLVLTTGLDAIGAHGARFLAGSVEFDNEPSRRMHETLGFRRTGLWKSNLQRLAHNVDCKEILVPVRTVNATRLLDEIRVQIPSGASNDEIAPACVVANYLLAGTSLSPWKKVPGYALQAVLPGNHKLYLSCTAGRDQYGFLAHFLTSEGDAKEAVRRVPLADLVEKRWSLFHYDDLPRELLGECTRRFMLYVRPVKM